MVFILNVNPLADIHNTNPLPPYKLQNMLIWIYFKKSQKNTPGANSETPGAIALGVWA